MVLKCWNSIFWVMLIAGFSLYMLGYFSIIGTRSAVFKNRKNK